MVSARLTGLVCGSILLLGAVAQAAPMSQTPGDPGLRDSRVGQDVPNISGVWTNRAPYTRQLAPIEGGDPPMLPWNKAKFDERAAAEKAGHPLYDPTAMCMPSGIPRLFAAPYPIEVVQTPERTVILYEVQHLFRIIHMNSQHPKDLKPSFMGHSIGHWEGDVLVVDTIGMTPQSQIDETGVMHTGAIHVVEHIQKVGGLLEFNVTIDDPGAFSRPWQAKRVFEWKPKTRFIEYVCEENNRNVPGADGVLRGF